jgi:uncharacterized protein YhdP
MCRRACVRRAKPLAADHPAGGELVFDRAGMQVRNAQGWFGEHSKVPLEAIQAAIPDLSTPVLDVSGHGKAALPAWLDVVARSPLAGITEHALDRAAAAGPPR